MREKEEIRIGLLIVSERDRVIEGIEIGIMRGRELEFWKEREEGLRRRIESVIWNVEVDYGVEWLIESLGRL